MEIRLNMTLGWKKNPFSPREILRLRDDLAPARPTTSKGQVAQNLRMQYPACRKKPPLCRMQLRVTAERACVPCVYSCPFTLRVSTKIRAFQSLSLSLRASGSLQKLLQSFRRYKNGRYTVVLWKVH